METNTVGIRYMGESQTITHVKSKQAAIIPRIRVIESIIDHKIQQVTPVPRVDRSVGSGAQIAFPFSPGKFSLASV